VLLSFSVSSSLKFTGQTGPFTVLAIQCIQRAELLATTGEPEPFLEVSSQSARL
jgi:hypothetical protein